MKSSDIKQTLKTLGLTDYEAKAYVCLVEKSSLNAGEISKLSEIPHSKTYEVLTRLEKRGIIEVQKGRPMIFRAVKPAITLESLERELKASLEEVFHEKKTSLESDLKQRLFEIAEARKTASEELGDLFGKNTTIESSEDVVWTIRGIDSLNAEVRDLIASADREVRLMFPRDDFSAVEDVIKAAFSKGVEVQFIVHDLTTSASKLLNVAEVFREEAAPPTNCGIVLVDNRKAMFISENYDTGFKTSSKSVIMVLFNFYEHEKEESAKVVLLNGKITPSK